MDRDPLVKAENDGKSAQVIQIESSRMLPIIVILAVLAGMAIAMSQYAIVRATDATTAANQERIYVDELTQVMVQAGITVPPREE